MVLFIQHHQLVLWLRTALDKEESALDVPHFLQTQTHF